MPRRKFDKSPTSFPVPKVKRRGYAKIRPLIGRALEEITREFNRRSALPESLCDEMLRFYRDVMKLREQGAVVNLVHRFAREGYRLGTSSKGPSAFDKAAAWLRNENRDKEVPARLLSASEKLHMSAKNVERIYLAAKKARRLFRESHVEEEQAKSRKRNAILGRKPVH